MKKKDKNLKLTFKQTVSYLFSMDFILESLEIIVSNRVFGVTLYITLMGAPFCVFLMPKYWNFFLHSPTFFLTSFICFFIPYFVIAKDKFLRNPFFLLPFTISFVLSSQTPIYLQFLQLYILFIGWAISSLGGLRTKPPYIFADFILEATTSFTWYGDAHLYWKRVLWVTIPVFFIITILLRYWDYF